MLGESSDLVGRGHPGAAVDPDGHGAGEPECVEPGAQRIRRQERAVPAEVLGGRCADRAGNVPGPGVHRLDLTAVAGTGPRVQQQTVPGRHGSSVGVQYRHPVAGQLHVTWFRSGHGPGLQRPARGDPPRQSTVEQPDLVQPTPAQQPPGPGGRRSTGRVVHDHPVTGADAPAAGGVLQRRGCRQRMPTGPGPDRPGEFRVQVDVHGRRQVGSKVVGVAVRVPESPADVQHHRRSRPGQLVPQHLGRHDDPVPRRVAPAGHGPRRCRRAGTGGHTSCPGHPPGSALRPRQQPCPPWSRTGAGRWRTRTRCRRRRRCLR